MEDLIVISKKNFKRYKDKPAFLCNCMRDFWLVIEVFTERVISSDIFWKIFNKALENEEPVFVLWLLQHISKLESYNDQFVEEGRCSNRITPNYTLLESKLKEVLLNASSDTVSECLKIIEPLLCDLWLKKARIEVYQVIWDYFSRRLNISNKQPVQTVSECNDRIQNILWSLKDCTNDFDIFVSMLVFHLRNHPTHWGKMKGRIFSQLGPNKVKDLNEIGVTHVFLLLSSLSSINFEELSKKIVTIFDYLPPEKRTTSLVWTLYVVVIISHVRAGHNIEKIVPFMLQMLQDASNNQRHFHLIKEFVTDFKHVVNYSKNLHLHQWLLLNTWLSKYTATCYHSDMRASLDVLLYVLEKVSNADCWSSWESSFKEYVYPALKQLSCTTSPPDLVGKFCGKLCLLIPDIATSFLDVVLESFPGSFLLSSQQESSVVQSWFRICLLTVDHRNLTRNVLKLDCFPLPMKSHLRNSEDPIYAFIEYLGSDVRQHSHSANINKLCELTFGQADKWLTPFLANPDDEATVFRIYTYISLAFLHCGVLLYDQEQEYFSFDQRTWHIFFEAIVKLNDVPDMFLERVLRRHGRQVHALLSHVGLAIKSPRCTSPRHAKEPDANMLKILNIISNFIQSTTSLPLMRIIVNKTLVGLFEVIIFHPQKNQVMNLVKLIASSPLFAQIKTEFNTAVLSVTERQLAFNTSNYFQLMFALAKVVPNEIKGLLGDVKRHISSVERMRRRDSIKNLRVLFEKLEDTVKIPK
ncbi:hypothetical protein NQ318_020854 [Aromia moschata]|uniref:Protein MMS22-like n=1 Tax=Aromia moschata TaxID=1265417 RepID=A0AAV8XI53_9CUCU|nr:hypothetical protein NQ318_020854 [Aromia moschata]